MSLDSPPRPSRHDEGNRSSVSPRPLTTPNEYSLTFPEARLGIELQDARPGALPT